MVASDIITLLSCDESMNDIITINAYDNGIEILYTNEEVAYIEFSEEEKKCLVSIIFTHTIH